MSSDSMTLYKLIILFILDKVDFPLTNAQLSNFILDKGYTNYFTIQQAIKELDASALLKGETVRNRSLFRITDAGKETLQFFNKEIGDTIKAEIISYLKENKFELREEVSSLSEYYEGKRGEYIAHCYVQEQGSKIIEINLTVPSEEDAVSICNNWANKSQELYAHLMQELL
ncbi:MAG: hypothetical protein PWP24_1570 [Clostridiales bacterium]|nr:hypothetical protein [Clostridiales bacterium]